MPKCHNRNVFEHFLFLWENAKILLFQIKNSFCPHFLGNWSIEPIPQWSKGPPSPKEIFFRF